MLRHIVTMRPDLDSRLLALLDAIDEPVSIASAVRDRDGRLLDFRLEFVNLAAEDWAGVPRESMIGRIAGELLPEFRSSGLFDTLAEVVETGVPYLEVGAEVEDTVTGGEWVGGVYDMRAIRLGDGYFGTWRRRAATTRPG
jgi:PAS domain-containing protein